MKILKWGSSSQQRQRVLEKHFVAAPSTRTIRDANPIKPLEKHWEVGFWDSLFWDKHESPAFSTHPNTTAMRATARNFLGQGTSARPWDRLHPPPRCSLSNVPPFESLPAAKVWRPLETHLNSQVWDMARRLITFQSFHHNPSPNARCHCWTSGRQ